MSVVWNQYQYTSSGLTHLAAAVIAGVQLRVWEGGQGFRQAKQHTHRVCVGVSVCVRERVRACKSVYVWNINKQYFFVEGSLFKAPEIWAFQKLFKDVRER